MVGDLGCRCKAGFRLPAARLISPINNPSERFPGPRPGPWIDPQMIDDRASCALIVGEDFLSLIIATKDLRPDANDYIAPSGHWDIPAGSLDGFK
jgi:hypothetical protein